MIDRTVEAKRAITKFKADHHLGFDPASVIHNPLLFWNSQHARTEHPELRIVSLRILSIPIGAISCERLFSALKLLVDSKSTRLTPKHHRVLLSVLPV